MEDKDKIKLWLEKEGYTQWINYVAIDRLVDYIDTEYLIPLKSEIMNKPILKATE